MLVLRAVSPSQMMKWTMNKIRWATSRSNKTQKSPTILMQFDQPPLHQSFPTNITSLASHELYQLSTQLASRTNPEMKRNEKTNATLKPLHYPVGPLQQKDLDWHPSQPPSLPICALFSRESCQNLRLLMHHIRHWLNETDVCPSELAGSQVPRHLAPPSPPHQKKKS